MTVIFGLKFNIQVLTPIRTPSERMNVKAASLHCSVRPEGAYH